MGRDNVQNFLVSLAQYTCICGGNGLHLLPIAVTLQLNRPKNLVGRHWPEFAPPTSG
jgi:hypothetical protein